ncbi:MAG: alpha/beta hydrolase [Planctomycetaceae bacterium]
MPLHPQAVAFLNEYHGLNPTSRDAIPLAVTRQQLLGTTDIPPSCPTPAKMEDRTLRGQSGEFRIRIHTPAGPGPFGGCVYFHGGGWVFGSIDTHDELVRRLVVETGCVFVNVDYPLAPEHKYPAALEDSYLATQWFVDHAEELGVDPQRIAVAGDSAGGNIAAVVALMARDRGGPKIAQQTLIYPITDCDFERPSYAENGKGRFLTFREVKWFWRQYVDAPEQMREPYASPLRAVSLAGLPPAYVLTAKYDPLRDEGRAYAEALEAAGVPTTLREFDGMFHGFVKRWDLFDDAKTATHELAAAIRAAIGAPS